MARAEAKKADKPEPDKPAGNGEKKDDDVIEGVVVRTDLVEATPQRAVANWTPQFVQPLEVMKQRRQMMLDYMSNTLKEGVHYGKIPGAGDKMVLFKPGGQALMRDLGLHPEPVIVEHISDVTGADHNGEVFMSYSIRTDLFALHDGGRQWVGSGIGACNSWEERYRWRAQQRKCPNCGMEAIIKGKAEWGGGWICWSKKNGCGSKFPDGAALIENQQVGKIANENVMDLDNTIFKQASKRSMIEAILSVTGASDVFTQDMEKEAGHEDDPAEAARAKATREASTKAGAATAPRGAARKSALNPMPHETRTLIENTVKALFPYIKAHPEDVAAKARHSAWTKFADGIGLNSWDDLRADDAEEALRILSIEMKAPAASTPAAASSPVGNAESAGPSAASTSGSSTSSEVAKPEPMPEVWRNTIREFYRSVFNLSKSDKPAAKEATEFVRVTWVAFMDGPVKHVTGASTWEALWSRKDLAEPAAAIIGIELPELGFDPDEVP